MHKRKILCISVAVLQLLQLIIALSLSLSPMGGREKTQKRVCTCTLSYVVYGGCVSEAETEGTHHLAAVVLDLSGLEVYVVEGIEVAFLS